MIMEGLMSKKEASPKETIKKEIIDLMTQYYWDVDHARKWYETNHPFLGPHGKPPRSPKDLVDEGRGEEVLKWVKLMLDK